MATDLIYRNSDSLTVAFTPRYDGRRRFIVLCFLLLQQRDIDKGKQQRRLYRSVFRDQVMSSIRPWG